MTANKKEVKRAEAVMTGKKVFKWIRHTRIVKEEPVYVIADSSEHAQAIWENNQISEGLLGTTDPKFHVNMVQGDPYAYIDWEWYDASDNMPCFVAEEYDDSNKFHRELIEKD